YFNVYGPRQDPTSQYAAVIPSFITRVLDGKPPVIYGDGEQTRDFTFVKDVVSANILAMKRGRGVFNIACGKRVSINELAHKVMEIAGVELEPVYEEARRGDVRHSLADISRARAELGYEPAYGLVDGLKETVEWFLKG
ncbi:MAG: GDP-mannose 4,6-dehydratase, partial [Methermicoccaceae archaeon]